MRIGGRRCALWVMVTALLMISGTNQTQANSFLPSAEDAKFLRGMIAAEQPSFDVPSGVTGISVPHHLLAADLIARGFWAASEGEYERIIVIGPDHFRAVESGFAIDASSHETALGPVQGDKAAAGALLANPELSEHPGIAQEHAIGALLPFIAHFFPGVPVVSMIAAVDAAPEDWAIAAQALAGVVSPDTLVVQSTDYSHFLPVGQAVTADLQTLAVIAAGEPDAVASLNQPDHMDALAAQYLQMTMQRAHFFAQAAVIANRNSRHYGGSTTDTTSYMVSVYHPNPQALSRFTYGDQQKLFIAGDLLTGRFLEPILADANALAGILNAVAQSTAGSPLVANLEGVIVDETVGNAPVGAHLMTSDTAVDVLRMLGVGAVGVANNHSHDFGTEAARETIEILRQNGIDAVPHGKIADLGALRVVALNLLEGKDPFADDLEVVCDLVVAPPIVVFVHWGTEYTNVAQRRQVDLVDQAANCGVAAVVGAHSHLASEKIELSARGLPFVYSLGNFLFDQTGDDVSGALLELRVFEQGTVALRLVPIPNLFELGRAEMR